MNNGIAARKPPEFRPNQDLRVFAPQAMPGAPKRKAPGLKPGALAQTAGLRLAADLDGGSTTKADGAAVRGDHLDPQCILVLEVRGVAGRAQRIQAALRRT